MTKECKESITIDLNQPRIPRQITRYKNKTYPQIGVVFTVRRLRLVLAAAKVEAAATAAAAEAAGNDAANYDQCFAPARGEHKVGVNVLFAKLLRNVQSKRTIIVVDVALREITQYGVRPVDILELLQRLGIVWVLVRVVLERQLFGLHNVQKKEIVRTFGE